MHRIKTTTLRPRYSLRTSEKAWPQIQTVDVSHASPCACPSLALNSIFPGLPELSRHALRRASVTRHTCMPVLTLLRAGVCTHRASNGTGEAPSADCCSVWPAGVAAHSAGLWTPSGTRLKVFKAASADFFFRGQDG